MLFVLLSEDLVVVLMLIWFLVLVSVSVVMLAADRVASRCRRISSSFRYFLPLIVVDNEKSLFNATS